MLIENSVVDADFDTSGPGHDVKKSQIVIKTLSSVFFSNGHDLANDSLVETTRNWVFEQFGCEYTNAKSESKTNFRGPPHAISEKKQFFAYHSQFFFFVHLKCHCTSVLNVKAERWVIESRRCSRQPRFRFIFRQVFHSMYTSAGWTNSFRPLSTPFQIKTSFCLSKLLHAYIASKKNKSAGKCNKLFYEWNHWQAFQNKFLLNSCISNSRTSAWSCYSEPDGVATGRS